VKNNSICHLKTASKILSEDAFDKHAIIYTKEGKMMISNYISKNVSNIHIKRNLVIDIDSQNHIAGCECQQAANCECTKYCTPVRATFTKADGLVSEEKMAHIRQRKGEGEMAQVDWLKESICDLEAADAVASYLTSGDIDSIPIHLYYISAHWPRNEMGTFKHPVFCILRKSKVIVDVYNITRIIETIEKGHNDDRLVCQRIAVGLCMGGNDFIPRMYRKSHTAILQLSLQEPFSATCCLLLEQC
jgi:uncharacterized protein YuzE